MINNYRLASGAPGAGRPKSKVSASLTIHQFDSDGMRS